MRNINDNIKDDELRVLAPSSNREHRKRVRLVVSLSVAALALVAAAVFALCHSLSDESTALIPEVYDPSAETVAHPSQTESIEFLGNYSDTTKAYTEVINMTVNDIPLDIYIPHNATPSLIIGRPSDNDTSIVFMTQAADIRADNGKINGAYVLAGEPRCWGLSKKGFVAIIDGNITIGVSENSPLFEEATEKGGYFFRQYALVNNGQLVENEPKNKSIRKAICERHGEIFIAMSQTCESFHDFAQALIDLQVSNAVYLVGSHSIGLYREYDGDVNEIGMMKVRVMKNENYIMWMK